VGLPRIIGITGYARHGKDTVAAVLTRELGYSRVALADRMKELMLVLNPAIPMMPGTKSFDEFGDDRFSEPDYGPYVYLKNLVEDLEWERTKTHPEVRRLMQVFGTEVGREGLGEDVWIKALAESTKGFYADRKIVIPDVRFTNEAAFIRRLNGEVWGVKRMEPRGGIKGIEGWVDFDNGLGANGSHASERDIPLLLQSAEVSFENKGPLSDFKDAVFRQIKFRMALQQAREDYRPALDALADA
jgi:hypothetical protein